MVLGKKKKTQKVDLEELGVKSMKKDLLGGSDSEEDKLTLNKEYAKDYDKEKQRKEFDSLRARVEYDEDSSEGTEEDEDGTLLDNGRDLKIFEALAALKSGDKETAAKNISTVNQDVKEHLDSILKGNRDFNDKKVTIKDYMREKLLEKGAKGVAHIESDEEAEYDKNYSDPNRSEADELKKAFIAAAEGEEDGFTVTKPKKEKTVKVDKKTKAEVEADAASWWESQQQKEQDVNSQLAKLFENVDPSDKNENFLKSFFLNHGWQGDAEDPTEGEIDEVLAEGEREDDFEENQIKFEEEYEKNKYRHEQEQSAVVQSHPRSHLIDDSLRKDTSTRKSARDRKKEREDEAKVKRDEEVKRLKHLKRQEMNEKLEELKKMAGAQAEELFTLAELEDDFDPDSWDKKMSSLFNEDYYEENDESFDPADEEKPVFSDMSDFEGGSSEGESDEASDDDDNVKKSSKVEKFDPYGEDSASDMSDLSSDSDSSSDSDNVKKTKKKQVKPTKQPKAKEVVSNDSRKEMEKRKAILLKQKEAAIGKAMEDYSKLDYEGVVGGEKVRFKYKNVPREQFALTDDDILGLDDRTLNEIAPLKYYAPYKSKADNARDSYVASQTKRRLQHVIDNPPEELQPSNKYRTGMAPVYIEYNEKAADEDLEKIKKGVAETTEGKKKKKKEPEKKDTEEKKKTKVDEGKKEVRVAEVEGKKKKKKKKSEKRKAEEPPKEEKKEVKVAEVEGKKKKSEKRKAEEPPKEEKKKKKAKKE